MMHALTTAFLCAALAMGACEQQQPSTSLDFSQAVEDPYTGELCVMQRVCLANPAALADRLPREPCPDPNAGNDVNDGDGNENDNGDLAPGCDCAADADCGGGDARCVACVCKACPVSTAATNSGVLNPPLTFVVDTTKSVKPDKYSIFNLTQRVVERIQETKVNIPRYSLVTFNDFGPNFNENVDFRLDTQVRKSLSFTHETSIHCYPNCISERLFSV